MTVEVEEVRAVLKLYIEEVAAREGEEGWIRGLAEDGGGGSRSFMRWLSYVSKKEEEGVW